MSQTTRLFWRDAYQTEFRAHVLRHISHAGRPALVLDETCFYPTSGGQPHDTGSLNQVSVLDVIETEDAIVHVLDAPLDTEAVLGRIDWPRRQDHMQQHAGQHILSAAFERLVGAGTLSFHLGASESTIDIDCVSLEFEQAAMVEEYANQIVTDNVPICTRQYTTQELIGIPLRKPPKVDGLVRVVSIGEIDYSACGGTHPDSAGQVGLIHIDRWERRRGAVRVTFTCGNRALHDYRIKSRICRKLAQQASVSIDELPDAMDRLSTALDESHCQARALRAQLLDLQADALRNAAECVGKVRVIARVLEQSEPAELRILAQRLCEKPNMVAILGASEPSAQFCLARSQDVPFDMNTVLQASAVRYGGRGGGQPNLVQGGGLPAQDLQSMVADALRYLHDEQESATEGNPSS